VDASFGRERHIGGFDLEESLQRTLQDEARFFVVDLLKALFFFRRGRAGLHFGPQVLMLLIQHPTPGIRSGYYPDSLTVGAAEEGKGVFAIIEMDEVTFAIGAASQRLDRIDRSHIGLDNGDHLFIFGVGTDVAQGQLRHSDAHGQARAHVPVKFDYFFNRLGVNHNAFLSERMTIHLTFPGVFKCQSTTSRKANRYEKLDISQLIF
jgi:hypothetical protein